jgi:hypothetical protein
MEVVILSKEQYDDMVKRIEEVKKMISQKSKKNKINFIDSQAFLQFINASKRKRRVWQNANIFILVIKIIVEVWFCT